MITEGKEETGKRGGKDEEKKQPKNPKKKEEEKRRQRRKQYDMKIGEKRGREGKKEERG